MASTARWLSWTTMVVLLCLLQQVAPRLHAAKVNKCASRKTLGRCAAKPGCCWVSRSKKCTSKCHCRAAGTTYCAGRCRNYRTDRRHCGRCNRACASNRRCKMGKCVLKLRSYRKPSSPRRPRLPSSSSASPKPNPTSRPSRQPPATSSPATPSSPSRSPAAASSAPGSSTTSPGGNATIVILIEGGTPAGPSASPASSSPIGCPEPSPAARSPTRSSPEPSPTSLSPISSPEPSPTTSPISSPEPSPTASSPTSSPELSPTTSSPIISSPEPSPAASSSPPAGSSSSSSPSPSPPAAGSNSSLLVDCTLPASDGDVCSVSSAPLANNATIGLCANGTCYGSQAAGLLQSQSFGKVDNLTFVGNDTAAFQVAGGVSAKLRLGAPASPTTTTMTIDNVVYTATFGSGDDGFIAVSSSNGVQLTIYQPANGTVRAVFYDPTLGSADVNVPFQLANITTSPNSSSSGSPVTGRRRLHQQGSGLCVPNAVNQFCAAWGGAQFVAQVLPTVKAEVRLFTFVLCMALAVEVPITIPACYNSVAAAEVILNGACVAVAIAEAVFDVPTCPKPPPPPPAATCNATQKSGNQGNFAFTIPVGNGANAVFVYDAFNIPDIFKIFDAGTNAKLFEVAAGDPGSCITPTSVGAGSVTITKPFASAMVVVEVDAPCGGTAWEFTMNCAA